MHKEQQRKGRAIAVYEYESVTEITQFVKIKSTTLHTFSGGKKDFHHWKRDEKDYEDRKIWLR